MKKYILAGACVLALAGCDQVKALLPSQTEDVAVASVQDPTEVARATFAAADTIVPSIELGKRVGISEGVTADLTESGTVIVTTSPETPVHSSGRPGGYSIALTQQQEAAYSNSKLTVSVLARAPSGAAKMRVAYSTSEVGNSGWRDFELGTEYSVSKFDYIVRPMQAGNGDFIGFLAEGGAIEIASIGFDSEKLPPPPAPVDTSTPEAAPE